MFCQQANGKVTTWIGAIDSAETLEEAMRLGREKCAEAWGREDIEEIHVMGVAEGDVNILYWEDQE